MTETATHTALIIPAPSVGELCRLAEQFPRSRTSAAVAHITIATPFVPEPELSITTLDALAAVAAATPVFVCRLSACRDFENGWYYLAPDELAPFSDPPSTVMATFPSLTARADAPSFVPHLSLGVERDAECRQHLMLEVSDMLPVEFVARHLMVVRSGPDDWVELASFEFG
ncbi:MAG: 2'-5' RNA ligase family protein [Ilumatobacteraceae bacterium]